MILDAEQAHYHDVIKAMARGRVVPLLGAGVNLCGRPVGAVWSHSDPKFLPSSRELAGFLATEFRYPPDERLDLARVSQYAAVMRSPQALYDELHDIFAPDYAPSALHTFLASLPGVLREKGPRPCYQLIVTTNYDSALEAAFHAADEPFDLVSYIADGKARGRFMHTPPEGPPKVIERPNEYADLSLERRTVILKIHGAVDRSDPLQDSYVITEDDYIDYLTRTNISELFPATLLAAMIQNSFLFLGYSMRDWNLRVMLHRIWGERKRKNESWSVQVTRDDIDRRFWKDRGVEILDIRLEQYVAELQAQLDRRFAAEVR